VEWRGSGEIGKKRKRHEQEFESGRVVLDRLFVLAQRECTLRVIERVADGRGWIGGWLSLLLAAEVILDEHFQNENTREDLRGHDNGRGGVLAQKDESGSRRPQSRPLALRLGAEST